MPMKAYSLDLRERIVRAVDQGYPRAEIVQLFGVSRATIKRYVKQRRETGHLRRKPIPGRPPQKSAPLQAQIVEQLDAHADATLQMHSHRPFPRLLSRRASVRGVLSRSFMKLLG